MNDPTESTPRRGVARPHAVFDPSSDMWHRSSAEDLTLDMAAERSRERFGPRSVITDCGVTISGSSLQESTLAALSADGKAICPVCARMGARP